MKFFTFLQILLSLAVYQAICTETPAVRHQFQADRTIAATSQPLATQAAINAFRAGGDAVDAAVAAGVTLGVVDVHNSGIGGGCFMLIHLPNGKIVALDGREMAPAKARRAMFLREGEGGFAIVQDWSAGIWDTGISGGV